MKTKTGKTIFLKDYQKPEFIITHSVLEIELDPGSTIVRACHCVSKQSAVTKDLVLHCQLMQVMQVTINGQKLRADQFKQTDEELIIPCKTDGESDEFELEIVNQIDPSANTALSGLYKSGDMLCTQCEAEGYRRITPGIDRPDNLGTYQVKLIANKSQYPTLLCNGNLLSQGDLVDDRHYTLWHDPFPKPTYLFAIVAGNLACLEDSFTTSSGKEVCLRFHAREKDINKCHHAMSSLKKSMTWDEEVYGREYDLDLFNIVAVDDFNTGAMENKSLNIFNTKYVLADSKMASDNDFNNVESVVGHEYFHNWSGNRVTCRDWFQLSLKEGFTVFRDQEFSADMGSRGVRRIENVNELRSYQFKEDASPMAHPVRPDSYQEINNFYTATVYNKGAEVVRMLHTILGKVKFRKGTDLYFDKYDGQAVTTDDFVSALETANDVDFSQFRNWYSQAGTPNVEIQTEYDQEEQTCKLVFTQSCAPTPGQDVKTPFEIPLKIALFSNQGEKLNLSDNEKERIVKLTQNTEIIVLKDIDCSPIISANRNFSAPIHLKNNLSDDQLAVLLSHDDDPFNRWEAGQSLFLKQILNDVSAVQNQLQTQQNKQLLCSFNLALKQPGDDAFTAKLIELPSISYISEMISPIDPTAIEQVRSSLTLKLANASITNLLNNYHRCQEINKGEPTSEQMAARSLRDGCLGYLCAKDDKQSRTLTFNQLQQSKCMTDSASAIHYIARSERPDKQQILDEFYSQWQDEALVINKWLRAQSTVAHKSTLQRVIELTEHVGFDYTNPNKVYSLILGFSHGNPYSFHNEDGSGYEFIYQWIKKLDPVNPQVTAQLTSALNGWKRYKPELGIQMQTTLRKITEIPNLSSDVAEIANKNLQ